ncbi:hypothetical protein L3X38_000367 [Prunus dulcis]|uniref:Transposable element protein n=1 Tax=Prunus dulcis TaxID=3755 RepID=A0AAD4YJQ0_PRUDU|nr:hypothetical protein L3X38_000367 [Prunus dulcis]
MFTWLPSDMPGIYPNIICLQLIVNPANKPVDQKRHNFTPERVAIIEAEIDKFLAANFIDEVAGATYQRLVTYWSKLLSVQTASRTSLRPFFKALKKGQKDKWDEEYKVAFQNLNTYLTSPPLLSKSVPSEHVHNSYHMKLNLDLLEGKRERAIVRVASYQQLKSYYDKMAKVRQFQLGDLVLKKTFITAQRQGLKKVKPNWEGPYMISQPGGR